jgi:hypothetical protein
MKFGSLLQSEDDEVRKNVIHAFTDLVADGNL